MRHRTKLQPHLEYRPSGFHWRRRWPHSLCFTGMPPLREKPMLFPLRTHVLSEAKILAQRITVMSDQIFAVVTEKTMPIPPDTAEHVLTTLIRLRIEASDLAREIAPRRSAEAALLEAAQYRAEQEVLRRALALRDRDVARAPLRHAMALHGVTIDETETDYQRLAMQALRALLDASAEAGRRDQGLFDAPSPVFRSVMGRSSNSDFSSFPSLATSESRMPTLDLIPPQITAPLHVAEHHAGPGPLPGHDVPPIPEIAAASHLNDSTTAGIAVQATLSTDQEEAPRALVSPAPVRHPAAAPIVAASESQPGLSVLLADAFDLYIAKKKAGFTDDFALDEVPCPASGEKWGRSTGNNMEVGKRLWVSLLGNRPIGEIPATDVKRVKALLPRIPATHGKSCNEIRDIEKLVEDTDAAEARQIERAVAEATLAGGSPAKIERARLDAQIPRLRVESLLKHVRALNRPAKMLVKLGILETSPFDRHMISNKSADAMRKMEEKRDRRPWDDRIFNFLATPVFRGASAEVGDPLFWAPLLALLGSGREEEILQLSPSDFESTDGIQYYRLRRCSGQSVKSDAGIRLIPVHPELIRLGLMRLVELRRREGEPRLFPHLQRGKHKETFTEIFTKKFTTYRKKHNVYWLGLDFHALRTTFHHRLMDNRTPGYIKRRLMGHEALDEGEKAYAQGGISMKTLQDEIKAISIDLSRVVSPFDLDAYTEDKVLRFAR